jgi:hypothetical protein
MADTSSSAEKRRKTARIEIQKIRKSTIASLASSHKKLDRAAKWFLMESIYNLVDRWRKDGDIDYVVEFSRKKMNASQRSFDYLVVLRFIFRKPGKRKIMSAWASALEYADRKNVAPEKFLHFLIEAGGINRAGRKMTKIRKKAKAKKGKQPSASAPL